GEHARYARGTDEEIDLVFGRELARVLRHLRGIGGVVQYDVVDLLSGDGRRTERRRILFRNAEHRGRTGGGDRHADVDVGPRGSGDGGGQRQRAHGSARPRVAG